MIFFFFCNLEIFNVVILKVVFFNEKKSYKYFYGYFLVIFIFLKVFLGLFIKNEFIFFISYGKKVRVFCLLYEVVRFFISLKT